MRGAVQVLALVISAVCPVATAVSAPSWFTQSWYFQWDPPGTPLPVPITAQCETIHVTWQRSTATGPDGVAPYYLQVYTSNFIFPFIIPAGPDPKADLTIPFAPGTEYQICMFDSNGNTGGCQAIYTVYPNSTVSNATCANWTMPANTLSVKSEYASGALSMYGWVDSCSDIRVTPQGGTPPFTFTVAPALHPPLNITSHDMSPINWTVSLSWGSPFFISLVDSTGLSWSNGPIHSGNGNTDCLAADRTSNHDRVSVPITVGAAVAGAVLGTIASLLAAFMISKRQDKRRRYGREREPTPYYTPSEIARYSSLSSQSSPPLDVHPFTTLSSQPPPLGKRSRSEPTNPASTGTLPREYEVEPFQRERSTRPTTSGSEDTSQIPRQSWQDIHETHIRSPSSIATSPALPERQEGNSQVYVIHHDSGRAPVSVITSRGTEVVELPPGYSRDYLAVSEATGAQEATTAHGSVQRRQAKSTSGPGGEPGRSS